jgi:surfactin synthase thioesterase subunit
MEFLLPTLRADFQLCDTYACDRRTQLDTPLVVFGGLDDLTARRDALEAWRSYTNGPVTVQMFPGNHFFLQTQKAAVLAAIQAALATI